LTIQAARVSKKSGVKWKIPAPKAVEAVGCRNLE